MKTLIVSDIHLGPHYDQRKYTYLQKLFSSVEQVILNGDFWSIGFGSFDDFVKSRWKQLFPLLLKKKTIYITGNHDKGEWMDERISQFCTQVVESFSFTEKDETFFITHGHTLVSSRLPIPASFVLFIRNSKIEYLVEYFEQFLVYLTGTGYVRFFTKSANQVALERNLNTNQYLIMGHTHLPEHNRDAKYLNTGAIRFGYASYAVVENGKISLVLERY